MPASETTQGPAQPPRGPAVGPAPGRAWPGLTHISETRPSTWLCPSQPGGPAGPLMASPSCCTGARSLPSPATSSLGTCEGPRVLLGVTMGLALLASWQARVAVVRTTSASAKSQAGALPGTPALPVHGGLSGCSHQQGSLTLPAARGVGGPHLQACLPSDQDPGDEEPGTSALAEGRGRRPAGTHNPWKGLSLGRGLVRTLVWLPPHPPRALLVLPRGCPEILVGGTLVQPKAHPELWGLPFPTGRLEVDTNDPFGSWSDSWRCPARPCPPAAQLPGKAAAASSP